mmetsp:Transcript_54064/g.124475  ORF Transcript_54064/g.124475 Transcript_54064/m.124475 type:complete len:233 (-) Transcript_54064:832-1530(-)
MQKKFRIEIQHALRQLIRRLALQRHRRHAHHPCSRPLREGEMRPGLVAADGGVLLCLGRLANLFFLANHRLGVLPVALRWLHLFNRLLWQGRGRGRGLGHHAHGVQKILCLGLQPHGHLEQSLQPEHPHHSCLRRYLRPRQPLQPSGWPRLHCLQCDHQLSIRDQFLLRPIPRRPRLFARREERQQRLLLGHLPEHLYLEQLLGGVAHRPELERRKKILQQILVKLQILSHF